MKKLFLYGLLAIASLNACRKSDNPKLPGLTRVPVPKFSLVANSDAVIDVSDDPALFKANFDLGLLFPDDEAPKQFDIVIIKNGDKSVVKTFKTGITTFPTNVQVTGTDLINLFGGTIVLGDFFDIGADMTIATGQKLDAFPAVGTQFSGGTANIPGSATFLRYAAICKFNADDFAGDVKVVTDEWADYQPGDVITLTKVDDTHLSFIYPTSEDRKPIVITINPNNSTTVNKVDFGRYEAGGDIYQAETAASIDNIVLPCDKTISVRLTITTAAGGGFSRTFLVKLEKE